MPVGDRGGKAAPKKKRPPPRPSRANKIATVAAAEQLLLPWEVRRKPKGPPPSPRYTTKPTGVPLAKPPAKKQTLDSRYKSALAAPVSPAARRHLAETMSPQRRRQVARSQRPYRPAPPSRDGFLDALTATPGSVARRVTGAAKAAPAISEAIGLTDVGRDIGTIFHPTRLIPSPSGRARGDMSLESMPGVRSLRTGVLGPELYEAAQEVGRGKRISNPWMAGISAAGLIPGVGKGIGTGAKLVKALSAVDAAMAGKKGAAAVKAGRDAYEATMAGPKISRQVVNAAKRTPLIRSDVQDELHAGVDAISASPAIAARTKESVDAHVYSLVRGLPPQQRKVAAESIYREALKDLPTEAPGREIRPFRDARVEAEANPHYSPHRGVRPLNGAETAAHIEQSIADAARMTSLEKDPAKMMETFRRAHRLAEMGAPFRRWYRVSARGILNHVHGDKGEADKLAQLFGIYSANRDVPANSVLAMRAYDEAKAGKQITQGSAKQAEAAAKVMSGEAWEGRKTNSFYSNMLKHIDPEKYKKEFGKREVTVDIWMMRMFGFTGKSPTAAQYDYIEKQIQELARQLGWQPEEVQAAAWVALKSQSEGTSLERAAFDFAHGLDTHRGQINFEAMTDELRERIPPMLHAEHLHDVLNVISPEGRSIIHRIVGAPGGEGHLGPGVEAVGDEILHNPGAAHYIPLLRSKGPTGDYVISDAERALAEEVAAAYGLVLNQPAVAYGRVFQAKTLGHANAVELTIPGGLSDDLAKRIAQAVGTDTPVVHSRNGAWLLNFTGTENKAWIKQMEKALDPFAKDIRQATAVAHDGGLIERNQYGDLLERLEQRRPGAGEALRGLEGDVARVGERYAERAVSFRDNPAAATRSLLTRLATEETGAFRPGAFLPERWFKRSAKQEAEEASRAAEETAGGVRYEPGHEPPAPEPVPEPPPTLEERVAGKLPEMEAVRMEQEAGYSLPRGQRSAAYIAKYQEMRERGLSATDADLIASRELEGELPKLSYKDFDFTPEERDRMVAIVHDSDLLPFQKKRATTAIRDAAEGKVPQLSQIKLLEDLFGKEKAEALAKAAEEEKNRLLELVRGLGGIPRSMQSTFDMSGTLRQALTVATRHPTIWKAGLKPSVRGMLTEPRYKHEMDLLARDPGFEPSEVAGVHYTEVGPKAARREEQYPSSLVEHGPVAVSARQYSLFLNTLRLQMWNKLLPETERLALKAAQKKPLRVAKKRVTRSKGLTEEQALKKAHKDLARYINSMTGRGPFPTKLEGAADLLNMTFFSPRLMASRFDLLLSPLTYATASPYVRRQAMRSMAQTIGIGLAVVYTASQAIPGATVEWDPRHTDFARIKIGDTRLDIWGGFQPQVRLISRLATGKFIGSSGKEWDLGTGGFGTSSRADIIIDYLRSKSSPNLSFFWDMADNQNIVGEKFEWSQQFWRLLPLLTHDVWDTWRDYSPARALGSGALGFFGIGAQTYKSGRKKSYPPIAPPAVPAGGFYGGGNGGGDFYGGGTDSGGFYGP